MRLLVYFSRHYYLKSYSKNELLAFLFSKCSNIQPLIRRFTDEFW